MGSNIIPMLLVSGCEVFLLKRTLSSIVRIEQLTANIKFINIDEVDLAQIFEQNSFDIILHCATNYGRRDIDPFNILEANLILPLKLIELGVKYGVKYFINTDTIIDKRISKYSLSKSQFKEWLKLYADRIGCINVALEHFYGPGDDDSKFVSYIIKQLISKQTTIELTPGDQKRDFIYVDDVVSAFELIISNVERFIPGYYDFQIGSNTLISIKDLVWLIARLSENKTTELKFGALPYRPNEIMESKVDTRNIMRLGWKCKVPIEIGLQHTISYALEQYNRTKSNDS